VPRRIHILVVLFLALHLALSVRGCLRDDDRYAWRMFSGTLRYRVTYRWIDGDGRAHAIQPALSGHARDHLRPDRWHRSFHGLGAVRANIAGLLAHLRERLPAAARVEADFTWRRGAADDWQHQTIEAP
jgi:hypothetical protein